MSDNIQTIQLLVDWYQLYKRALPWRKDRDPYRVWISETMLQQTTTAAVLNYFERFLERFPTLQELAAAKQEEVYAVWAGLGYYSRARNLLAAAQKLNQYAEFPQKWEELIELPGFGPYTARAVSSIAFSEPVGVLDGNVIRVLTRKENRKEEWWKPKGRATLQKRVDEWVQATPITSDIVNQALMELGSQICLPLNPHCQLCPWTKFCIARQKKCISSLPKKKPKIAMQKWIWQPALTREKGLVFLEKNNYAPFLKNSWFLPGRALQVEEAPKNYDFRHTITHYDIYVQIQLKKVKMKSTLNKKVKPTDLSVHSQWVREDKVKEWVPASLIGKVIQHAKS